MKVGDRVVFLDDEPELDLSQGTLATVVDVRGPDDIDFQLADGRTFTTGQSSLDLAPPAEHSPRSAGTSRSMTEASPWREPR
jgi:hypothetical protein